jgi:hypothetical protein
MASFFAREPLTVMLSSRCDDKVLYKGKKVPLAEVRVAIKESLQSIRMGDSAVFKVWIHEPESVTAGNKTSWDQCIDRARRADIFVALFNGNAGWAGTDDRKGEELGICHAELATAYSRCPSKVRRIALPIDGVPRNSANSKFQAFFQRFSRPAVQAKTGEEAIERAIEVSTAALLDLARAGVGVGSGGGFSAGEALEWSRMDFQGRRKVTVETMVEYLAQRSGRPSQFTGNTVVLPIKGTAVAFACDCVPAAMSVAAARELVGQPFLRDHELGRELAKDVAGPVHVVACQKAVTEAQALRQLGFPDAVCVSAPFGIYLADDVQKIQMVFIVNCRDELNTQQNLKRFLAWIDEEAEDLLLVKRAKSRRRIANLIAEESVPTIQRRSKRQRHR